jgi:hypothetical protein
MSDDHLRNLLCSAFPRPESAKPSSDVWPLIVERIQAPAEWSRFDLCVAAGVAAGVTIMLVMLPKALLLLAYHL